MRCAYCALLAAGIRSPRTATLRSAQARHPCSLDPGSPCRDDLAFFELEAELSRFNQPRQLGLQRMPARLEPFALLLPVGIERADQRPEARRVIAVAQVA